MIDQAHARDCLRRIAQAINDLGGYGCGPILLRVAESALPAFGEPHEVTVNDAGWMRVEMTMDGVRFNIDGPHYRLVYQGRAPI